MQLLHQQEEQVCPQGFHWDETLGRCIISPQQCPTNYRWEPAQNKCVPNTTTPPPTGADPIVGVEWYYDSTATLNTPQTISAGSSDSVEGIIIVSPWAGVTSMSIANGWLTIKSGTVEPGTTGRVGIDYYKKSRYSADDKPGFNTVFTLSFEYNGNISINIMDGNDATGGGAYAIPNFIFSGFQMSLLGPDPSPTTGFFDGVQYKSSIIMLI